MRFWKCAYLHDVPARVLDGVVQRLGVEGVEGVEGDQQASAARKPSAKLCDGGFKLGWFVMRWEGGGLVMESDHRAPSTPLAHAFKLGAKIGDDSPAATHRVTLVVRSVRPRPSAHQGFHGLCVWGAEEASAASARHW